MNSSYNVHHVKVRALRDHVIVTGMNFGERKTESGIILRSDDAKSHGVRARWGQVYKIGPEQSDVKVGQWILIEHGRWTRKVRIDDGESEKDIWRVDTNCILAVSDTAPSAADDTIMDSI
jgi:co-chaperonin GroES (HSP10)